MMCAGSLLIAAFTVVLGANFAALVNYALGDDE
jgi:hypothetical protein